MVKLNQIRAARGLIGWHQKDLARIAKISELSVINIENGKTSPQQSTLEKIISAFELAGVSFTTAGVEMKDTSFTVLSGEDWYVRMLEDVEHTLNNASEKEYKHWYLFHSDDKLSPPPVIRKIQEMRRMGFNQRNFILEGNVYIQGPLSEYRYIPKKIFNSKVLVSCYGDKLSICEQKTNESKVYIFRNSELASFVRGIGELFWDILSQPTKTTAEQVFF